MSRDGRAVRALGGCVATVVAAIVVGLLLLGLVEVLRMLAVALVSMSWGGAGL